MAYLNQDYINNLTEQINQCPDCQALQTLATDQIKVYFDKMLADVTRDVANLALLKDVPSSDIGGIIGWITNYVNLINNQYTKLVAIEAEIISTYSTLLSAITSKMSSLNCTFTPPGGIV